MAICANGHENPEGAAFCTACGTPLTATPPPPPPPAPTVPTAPTTPVDTSAWAPPPGPFAGTTPPPGTPPAGAPTYASPAPPFETATFGAVPGQEPSKKKRRWPLVVGGIVAVAAIGGGAVVALDAFGGDEASDMVILGDPSSESNERLSVAKLGEDEERSSFAKDASIETLSDLAPPSKRYEDPLPEVLPVGGKLLTGWSDDESTTFALVSTGDDDPEVIFDEDGYATAAVDEAREHLLIENGEDDSTTCYAGKLGEELEEVASADVCTFTRAGLVLAHDYADDEGEDTYQVKVTDLAGDEVSSFAIDGMPLAFGSGNLTYASTSDRLTVIDLRSGDEVASIEADSLTVLDSSEEADVLLYATTTDDEAVLWSVDGDGNEQELARAASVTGALTEDGKTVIAGTQDEDGQVQLSRVPSSGGDLDPILDASEGLQHGILDGPRPAVVAWDPDGGVWMGSATSGELASVGEVDGLPNAAAFDPESGTGYLSAYDTEDGEQTLFRVDGELDPILEGWSNVTILDVDGPRVVVNAWDEDEDALVSVVDGKEEELASAERINGIRVHGEDLVFTTYEDPEDYTGADVWRVPMDGSAKAEKIFAGRSLDGVSWAEDGRPATYLGGSEESDANLWVGSSAACGDVEEIDGSASGDIDDSGTTHCLVVPEGGADVVISVDADLDTVLTMNDEEGTEVGYSDDGEDGDSWNPYIETYLDGGTYFLALDTYDSGDSGTYTMDVSLD